MVTVRILIEGLLLVLVDTQLIIFPVCPFSLSTESTAPPKNPGLEDRPKPDRVPALRVRPPPRSCSRAQRAVRAFAGGCLQVMKRTLSVVHTYFSAMPPPFGATWGTLCERCEELPADATLITPLANKRFRVTDVQEPCIIIEDTDTGDSQPLQREQFEALVEHTRDAIEGFDLDRLPLKAEPYAAVLALHPRYVLDEREATLTELNEADESAVLDETPHLSTATTDEDSDDREEPDVPLYADMLLLFDALEREDPTALGEIETSALINLYTLLSDVQRNANDLRKDVSNVLLERVQHDRPVHGQYGSVQRTTRRRRSLKDDEDVLAALESAGIDREQLLSVDREKVDEALDVVSLPESAVYETDESEYVRKAEVDEERKETRLQGLKDRLGVSDDPKVEVLRQEIERLEQEIEDLTQFSPGSAFGEQAESG